MNDMGHMDHLEAVAAADVAHLREKEITYRGSWKKRGGVGAFMMLARKWDRLEGMLENEGPGIYDIFGSIAYPGKDTGLDGTALAEVRDLRRYLLLVEAEMVSRGVVRLNGVEPPVDGTSNESDLYTQMSEVWGVTRSEARKRLCRMAFGSDRGHETVEQVMSSLQYKWRLDEAGVVAQLRKIVFNSPDTIPRTDSNRHATSNWQWEGEWRTELFQSPKPPTMRTIMDGLPVADYIAAGLHYLPIPDTGLAIVDRREHPVEVWEHLPRLVPELNAREGTDLNQEYRWMYRWDESKYLLLDLYRREWGREP